MTENTQTTEIKSFKRNENGLIDGINYIYNSLGAIDWKLMINPIYLVPNKQKTQETDISKLQDKDLLILLQGFREILRTRGFHSIKYPVINSSPNHCTVVCEIVLIKNIECPEPMTISAVADATPENINGTGPFKYFLAPIAENRAFVRCVKAGLGISILGADEIGDTKLMEEVTSNNSNIGIKSPTEILKDLMDKHHYSFENIKAKLIKEGDKDAELYSNLEEIPPGKKLHLIERIKAKDNKK